MATATLERLPDGVRVLMLDDPDRRNALGHELGEALAAAIAEVELVVFDTDDEQAQDRACERGAQAEQDTNALRDLVSR